MIYTNAWKALSEEFNPTTGDALIAQLGEFNESKLENVKLDVIEWITDLEMKASEVEVTRL